MSGSLVVVLRCRQGGGKELASQRCLSVLPQHTIQRRPSLRRRVQRVAGVGLSLALAILAALAVGQGRSAAQSPSTTTLAIDTDPAGNTATSLGTIDACRAVATGERFDVDVVVADVPPIAGWDSYLTFDGSVVRVVAVDVNLFLAAATGSSVANLSDPLPNSSGKHLVASVDLAAESQESGSGVLGRLTLEAVGPGVSQLGLDEPELINMDRNYIGDTNGDGYFDGPLLTGEIRVDQSCPSGPVAPTPAATAATATVPPTGTAIAGQTPTAPTPPPPTTAEQEESGGAFPWAVACGAGAAGLVAVLALGWLAWRLARRSS